MRAEATTLPLASPPADADESGGPRAPGPWRRPLRRLRANRSAMGAAALLTTLAVVGALAGVLAPYPPNAQLDIIGLKSQPPSLAHPFGTDPLSRDVLSRVLDGSRVSLAVAVTSVLLSTILGTAYGATAGMAGRRVDALMMRAVDALAAVPRVLLLVAVFAFWQDPVPAALVLLIGATGWFATSRLVRAQVRSVREREFVAAAQALGGSPRRVLVRHVLPNVLSPIVVSATLGVGDVIALEAALAYLGIGIGPPYASWGNIIHEGAEYPTTLWWMSLGSGLAIIMTVMAVNVLGDALRDVLDPRTGSAE